MSASAWMAAAGASNMDLLRFIDLTKRSVYDLSNDDHELCLVVMRITITRHSIEDKLRVIVGSFRLHSFFLFANRLVMW